MGMSLVFGAATGLRANPDPFGLPDTLEVKSSSGGVGDTVKLPVRVFNDEYLGYVGLPVTYRKDKLSLVKVDFQSPRLSSILPAIFPIAPVDSTGSDSILNNSDPNLGSVRVGIFFPPSARLGPGDGVLFYLKFQVKATALVGENLNIDTATILVKKMPTSRISLQFIDTLGDSTFAPVFKPGAIQVLAANLPPSFSVLPSSYTVAEGDSLAFNVTATDPEGDPIILKSVLLPPGATFVDLGGGMGRFRFLPPYLGAGSASGSPYSASISAEDARHRVFYTFQVNVTNVNRPPSILAPGTLTGTAGDSIKFSVSATDPDSEQVTISASGLPAGAVLAGTNPVQFLWKPALSDTGTRAVLFTGTDPGGLTASKTVFVVVSPTVSYAMRIDSVPGALGQPVTAAVRVTNADPVGGFDIRVSYDPTAESLLSVQRGSRIADPTQWEMFSAGTLDTLGLREVHIVGIANTIIPGYAPPLPPGSGPLATLNFQVRNEARLSGSFLPVIFVFHSQKDNAFSDSSGNVFIGQGVVRYSNGGVNLASTGISDGPGTRPREFWLGQNYPNPFNPTTTIEFNLPSSGSASLTIYDILGRTVARPVSRQLAAGKHEVVWDGRDQNGLPAASGVYFYRLVCGEFMETKKMIMVK